MGKPNDYAPPPPPPPNEYVPQPPPLPPATAPPLVTGVPMIPMGATPYMHYAPSANPVIQMPQPQGDGDWSTGLFGCTEDIGNCCMTFWCPCVTFGQIAEIIDRGSPSCGASGALYALVAVLTGCQCIYSCFYRSKLRAQYILPESPCPDFLVHWCCEACALCQAYRELKNRGYDMALGWHGNMVRQQSYGVNQPPPVQGGMIR